MTATATAHNPQMGLPQRLAKWHCCLALKNKLPETAPGESLICRQVQNSSKLIRTTL